MLTVCQACNWGLFALSALKLKTYTKRPSHTKSWHLLYYVQKVQQVFSFYSLISNYLLEYFKTERT